MEGAPVPEPAAGGFQLENAAMSHLCEPWSGAAPNHDANSLADQGARLRPASGEISLFLASLGTNRPFGI